MSDSDHTKIKRFCYNAKVVRVVDGDTIDLMVDLGFSGPTEPVIDSKSLADGSRFRISPESELRQILDYRFSRSILFEFIFG